MKMQAASVTHPRAPTSTATTPQTATGRAATRRRHSAEPSGALTQPAES